MIQRLTSVCLGLLMVVGCVTETVDSGFYDEAPVAIASPEEFDERLKAAESITQIDQRDLAFHEIALAAAAADQVSMTMVALEGITAIDTRDTTAEQAAQLFVEIGDRKSARKVAETITMIHIRDRVYSHIAGSGQAR